MSQNRMEKCPDSRVRECELAPIVLVASFYMGLFALLYWAAMAILG